MSLSTNHSFQVYQMLFAKWLEISFLLVVKQYLWSWHTVFLQKLAIRQIAYVSGKQVTT